MSNTRNLYRFLCLMVFFMMFGGGGYGQTESECTEKRVIDLLALPIPADAPRIRRDIRTLGPCVSRILVSVLNREEKFSLPKRLFIFDLFEENVSASEVDLVLSLLENSSTQIRGRAVIFSGAKKLDTAVPYLITLLKDEAVYLTRVQTDPYREENVLLKTLALVELERITGKVPPPKLKEKDLIKFWEKWWKEMGTGNNGNGFSQTIPVLGIPFHLF